MKCTCNMPVWVSNPMYHDLTCELTKAREMKHHTVTLEELESLLGYSTMTLASQGNRKILEFYSHPFNKERFFSVSGPGGYFGKFERIEDAITQYNAL